MIVLGVFAILFVLWLSRVWPRSDPILDRVVEDFATVYPDVRRTVVRPGSRAHTVNKRTIYICLKDRVGRYYSRNMLLNVLAHEYAHTKSRSVGHTAEFLQNYAAVLRGLSRAGVYDLQRWEQENAQSYCK
jgi:hypothetical protein